MAFLTSRAFLLCLVGIIFLARPTHAFGAGNIASVSKVEGQNWRHGDIEDTLLKIVASRALGRKFSKLDVKRVYFGNWLRDYSQAVDVGTVKYVSAKAITILLWVLGFMSFGYGSKEFEVTMDRLGCYRPEEHIDNPKDYADNEDARQYDRRLRGRVDERKELAVDHETGMKSYIASENVGITTSAGLVRELFGQCIELGRRYNRNGNKDDLYEALRLLGTGCHCLEDFSAHSNYTELALIELGEQDVFPHVGRNTRIQLRGARHSVFPLITGTFGGVDFLHSVTGEFDDKVTQSEIQELENTMQQAQQNQGDTSVLQDLLQKLPDGMFGGTNEAGKADELKQNAAAHQMQNTSISPRQPEEWTRYLDDVQKQIYPIIEFHDEIMKTITETIEKIPILPDLLENLQEQLNVFVFSLIAPFVLPVINQVKTELTTGSSAIIESSVQAQHIVFHDDNSSDPTHSMLSKDHFSNVLNEPAGKVASQVLKWVVPQIMAAWDDERTDVQRILNRIIQGVMHHPALRQGGQDGAQDGRQLMFSVVQQWWSEQSEREKDGLRDQLSREGVESGRNHKPGVVDHGHGSCKPLGMPGMNTMTSSGAPGGGFIPSGGFSGQSQVTDQAGRIAAEAVGGGALGGLVSGLVSNLGGGILGGGSDDGPQTYSQTSYGNNGRTQTVTQNYQTDNGYGRTQYSHTESHQGGGGSEYSRFEQTTSSNYSYQTGGHGHQQDDTFSGRHHEGGRHEPYQSTHTGFGSDEEPSNYERRHGSSQHRGHPPTQDNYQPDSESDRSRHRRDNDDFASQGYGSQQAPGFENSGRFQAQEQSYGRRRNDDSESFDRPFGEEAHVPGGFEAQDDQEYSGRRQGYGSRQDYHRNRQEESRYGDSDEPRSGRQESGYGEQAEPRFNQREQHSFDRTYDQPDESFGGQEEYGRRRGGENDDYEDEGSRGYGGGRNEDEDQQYRNRRNDEDESY